MHELGTVEPVGTREGLVIAAIGQAYAPADTVMRLTTRQTTACGGVALSPLLTNRIVVREAMKHGLTLKQNMVLWYRFGRDKTQQATATHFHLPLNTVRIEEVGGLQTLVRLFWDDPQYVSPPRVRRLNPTADVLMGLARRVS